MSCPSWHLVWISPIDHASGNFGQGIKVIKLFWVDFDGHNANITLKICTHLVYTCLCCVKILVSFLEKHLRYKGKGVNLTPPPANFEHLQTLLVIGLRLTRNDIHPSHAKTKQKWKYWKSKRFMKVDISWLDQAIIRLTKNYIITLTSIHLMYKRCENENIKK